MGRADARVVMSDTDARSPSLVWTGGEYGLAWQEGSGEAAYVRFLRLRWDLEPLQAPVSVLANVRRSWEPSLAYGGCRYALAAATTRVVERRIQFPIVFTHGCGHPPSGCCWLDDVDTVYFAPHRVGAVLAPG